jgi:hypothetical protein
LNVLMLCSNLRVLRLLLFGIMLLGPLGSRGQPPKHEAHRATGSPALCEAILTYPDADLRADFHEARVSLPGALSTANEGDFDFFNDGKIDRVFLADFGGHYLLGSLLLVQPGLSPDRVKIANDDPLKDPGTWFIPCQLEPEAKTISECPPFSQANDEAGLTVTNAEGTKTIRFRGRYTELNPVRYDGVTYLIMRAVSEGAGELNYSAVIEPLPGRKFSVVCLAKGALT